MNTEGPKEAAPDKAANRNIRKTDLRRGRGSESGRGAPPSPRDGNAESKEKLLEACRRLIEETREGR